MGSFCGSGVFWVALMLAVVFLTGGPSGTGVFLMVLSTQNASVEFLRTLIYPIIN